MKLLCPIPILLAALVIGSQSHAAESSPSAQPTVEALVSQALTSNPELRYYESEIVAARAALDASSRRSPPEINGSAGGMSSRGGGGQSQGDGTAWSVGVTQAFEWPGRLGLRRAIANHDVTLARLGLERFRTALAVRVRGQAHSAAAGGEKARVTREVADRFRALREVLVLRDPAGIAPELEIRILEATEVGLRRRASEAELAADAARVELNHLLGRAPDATLEVAPASPAMKPLPSLAELVAGAATNNFDLRLREVELGQQGVRVALARNERWPAITVGPQFTEENGGGQDRILGLGVSFPLPLWRNAAPKVEAMKARQAQAETLLIVTRRDLERRIAIALRSCETRRAEMQTWRADAVRQFADAAALADRHYRLGAVPATTYVELQKQYVEAVETLLETRRELLASASELEELTGLQLIERP